MYCNCPRLSNTVKQNVTVNYTIYELFSYHIMIRLMIPASTFPGRILDYCTSCYVLVFQNGTMRFRASRKIKELHTFALFPSWRETKIELNPGQACPLFLSLKLKSKWHQGAEGPKWFWSSFAGIGSARYSDLCATRLDALCLGAAGLDGFSLSAVGLGASSPDAAGLGASFVEATGLGAARLGAYDFDAAGLAAYGLMLLVLVHVVLVLLVLVFIVFVLLVLLLMVWCC